MNICGRYLVDDEVYAGIWEMLNSSAQTQNLARGEVFPTNIAPVIARDGVMVAKWGFPHWKSTGVIINARAETASEKKMFKKPLSEQRCVILSGGFFEWSHGSGEGLKTSFKQSGDSCGAIDDSLRTSFKQSGNSCGAIDEGLKTSFKQSGNSCGAIDDSLRINLSNHTVADPCASQIAPARSNRKLKDKYLFRQPGVHMLYMAGMMSIFRDAFGNEYSAFVILTTSANDSMAPIHDRMPVILAPDERNLWINDDRFWEYAIHRVGPELEPELIGK